MITRVEEVENHFIEKISRHELVPGDKIPSVKDIKILLDVGHVTAAHALQNLSKKGYVKTVRGRGSFVCELVNVKSSGIITYAFGHGISPELTGFYMRVYQAAKNSAGTSDYDLDFTAIDLTDSAESRFDSTDGAVAIIFDTDNILDQCNLQSFQSHGVPLVYCGMGSNLFNLNSVMPDNYAGARLATEHLIKNGHQNIAFVNVFDENIDYRCIERERGWKDVISLNGLNATATLQWHQQNYSKPVISLLNKIKNSEKNAPTALLVANDAMAMEIKQTATQMGISIPNDLSIMGFENHPFSEPHAISTISCYEADLGREAILLVERILKHPACQPLHVRLPMRIIERNSVKCIN